jgi:2-methylcitrate dehydratase PrpD
LLSLQYCVADVLVRGSISVEDFWTSERLKDEVVRRLMKKVKVIEDEEMTRMSNETHQQSNPIRLEIVMKNGQVFNQRVDYSKGSPGNLISESEIMEKFRDLASTILSETKSKGLMDSIAHLEEIPNVKELAESLY